MNIRASRIVLVVAACLLPACGGESASSPPPEMPPSSGAAEREEAPPPPPEADHGPEPGEGPAASEDTKSPKPSATSEDKPATAASDVPGANLSIGQLEADGLMAKDIQCKTEGGGMALLGAVLVTAWMSPQKKALDACAPAGTETRVVWKARGGKVTDVQAAGSPKVKACVERALSGGKPVLEGHCAATVVHGK
ncbi:hypothetical protein [Polyangium jinanense]|uniref:Uncharacterized protein n=1 Tax=Polyangium jinanense TaxID=2829994 RepID=A0A9X3X3E2_9BACT|nr:hypothetical protein [Polyangium jinanense]MDC3954408.1 hypothetical protein [Polyangium jinanense]MDC3980711.1 hypothetical protein [Polyangium jinanense]